MRICVHDVLQSTNLSRNQEIAIKEKPLFKWFKEAVPLLRKYNPKMAIVAEGVETNKEWVDLIKKNKWEVQCHGYSHIEMHHWAEDDIYEQLKAAKQKIEDTFHQTVTEFHPPRLKVCPNMYEACRRLQMSLVMSRWRPAHILLGMNVPEVFIHYWSKNHLEQCRLLQGKK